MPNVLTYLVVCSVAFGASLLTLFSGFGLGTLLVPAFALFFPIEVSIGMAAVVHLANNLFKLGLLGKHAKIGVVARFGLPAVPAAMLGAWTLARLADLPPAFGYVAFGRELQVHWVKLIVAGLILVFAALEGHPNLRRLQFGERLLPLGGFVSGFFGGLSGHQGALRSAFLVRLRLEPAQFVATGVACAVLVDLSRLGVYASRTRWSEAEKSAWLLVIACVAAFSGAFLGSRLLRKTTIAKLRAIVAWTLVAFAILLGSGVI